MHDLADGWLADLERRHLADLTLSEVARALRALSSCYVERRSRLADGEALGSRGKRAAFALFYGPLHFFVTREIVRALTESWSDLRSIVDLGCGTGAGGAAWAATAQIPRVLGVDRSAWAVREAVLTYRAFRLDGRVVRRDLGGLPSFRAEPATGLLAAYAINELVDAARPALLRALLAARQAGSRILVIEPIARRTTPWWGEWRASFERLGGRSDDWRFDVPLPPTQQQLARAASLDPHALTARSLFA